MKLLKLLSFVLVTSLGFSSCQAQPTKKTTLKAPKGKAIAGFGTGCFWASDYIFSHVAGVDSAVAGYAGGTKVNPTYEQVCSETTGHAEAVLVYYDPKEVSYTTLLDAFFAAHDPTQVDRQGPDVGTSYRSVIFYGNADEKAKAQAAIRKYSSKFKDPIASELEPLNAFYRAEGYHQDYMRSHMSAGYIRNVSIPKYNHFLKDFSGKKK